jgi:hypothetical protein
LFETFHLMFLLGLAMTVGKILLLSDDEEPMQFTASLDQYSILVI